MTQITIAGKTFEVSPTYTEGHVLTANEAAALNQVRFENIRNNMAKRVKELDDSGAFDQDSAQAEVDKYASEYVFGVRTGGGGRTSDPVLAEAMNIARDAVRKALAKKGHKVSDVPASRISELAKEAIDKNPAILQTARKRVEEAASIGDLDMGDLDSSSESGDAPKKGKKAAA